jgi:hypothetical protein
MGQLKLLFLGEKKGLSCSPRQFKLFLPRDMIVPCGKKQFFRGQCTFLVERHKFPKETYVSKNLAIIIISYLFLYKLATYHWKCLEGNYNFIVGSYTFAPQGNLHLFLPGGQPYAWGSNSLKEQPCFLGEQMCLKLCVNTTFSYEL